jgi:acyl transferase domain-containing protein/NAD(P)H-dependent flavin oxidoreductase YrpB (nitropropane dioxygenase family)/NAD(P)-dependent dehydrogenase (short-subunit alcohol dehydrogenase family)
LTWSPPEHSQGYPPDLFWGVTPFGQPQSALVVALARAGAFGVLDVGLCANRAHAAIASCAAAIGTDASFGIRVGDTDVVGPADLPAEVSTVVVASGSALCKASLERWGGRRVIVEVTSLGSAREALDKGAAGLVAKGSEAGGRVGGTGAFILLQQLAAAVDVPLWCQGGIGLHTAAAAVAGGATGVVLDAQLALVKEMHLPAEVRGAIASMDGSETVVLGGHRLLVRPGIAAGDIAQDADPAEVASLLGVELATALLPAGQDAAFAARMHERFHTGGGVVHAVRSAIRSQLRSAAASQVLGSGSAFAAAFGLRYPIVQGPMTRVSDRPELALAVAQEGGLPFLALALMTPEAVRALLAETSTALAGRPWGAGILGFVPPELRAGQLAAVMEARPTAALIAGGRPSLARPLEEAGIATFLHVPSPGLLELFVREGARRFVFEGRECGGHVGPRSSLVLWEQQIAQLLEGDVEGMDLLFAGGIHDARSAAMVAAMTAPLAERGARIGLLMGTAYLFTHEAVSTGAIREPFQAAAIACEATALLETSPGHSTRCAQTPFLHRFEDERRALEAAGVAGPDRWAALEDLNLGRLRMAAKGIRRDGDHLVPVDEDEQRREGLYMIGEVATLRSEPTTIAALHHDVSVASAAVLDRALLVEVPLAAPLDVAVIGMACLFPGAEDVAQYWANIVAGTNHVSEVPAGRWEAELYCSAEAMGPAETVTPSRWGGFLGAAPFDPMKYGIPPWSLGAIEPVQLLSLEVAAKALADAGYARRSFDRSRTSVIFGVEGASELSSAYVFRALAPGYLGSLPPALDEHLPALTEDSFPGVLSNVVAGRIANRLDLGGANYSVDAACAASLAAIHLACQELVGGGSEMVLCGGADLHNGIYDYQLFASVGALSPTGACKSFDEGADGIVLGEGVACVVLKRLADATRDGDRIYAVIKGVGASSDGRGLGLTAPRSEGQRAALHRAYQRAGASPATVGLVEAHGTGTVVGDRTELSSLTGFFSDAGSAPGSCTLGSVKAQIGHTKCAAGMAGLIKASLALYHAVRPPSAHVTHPSTAYDPCTSPFAFSTTALPWAQTHRRAGVSAFGFGGSNFHVVMDSHDHDRAAHGLDRWPAELFCFRGEHPSVLAEQIEGLVHRLDEPNGARLRDLAGDLWCRGSGPTRAAIVATCPEDLRAKLAAAAARRSGQGVYLSAERAGPKGLAFLFPGQGSQRPAMLAELFVAFPWLHELLRLGEGYLRLMFPPTSAIPGRTEAQRVALDDTRAAQPTLGMAGLAVARLLDRLGVVPDALGGHSYGEMVALSAAGAFDAAELIRLSEQRAEAMAESCPHEPGAMVVVAAPAERVAALVGAWPRLVVANDNSPNQVVISGPAREVTEAARWLAEQGLASRALGVSCGFHSPLMGAAATRFATALDKVDIGSPALTVWSNLTAAAYPDDPAGIRRTLAAQIDNPVRFREQIEAMYDSGIGTFVETGPGQVLTRLVGRILAGRPHHSICVDAPGVHGIEQLLHALASLGVAGVPLLLGPLFEGRDIAQIGTRQSTAGVWTIDGHLVRGPDGTQVSGGLQPATQLRGVRSAAAAAPSAACPTAPAPTAATPSAACPTAPAPTAAAPLAVPAPEGDPVMLEYMRMLSQVVNAGQVALARYLDARNGQPMAPLAAPMMPVLPLAVPTMLPIESNGDAVHATSLPGPGVEPTRAIAPRPPRSREDLLAAVVAVVSERTGYPVEMLGAHLDLEADLSIDSIKRIEIVGDLVGRVGLSTGADGLDDSMVEELAVLKTLSAIVEWILARAVVPQEPMRPPAAPVPEPPLHAARFVQRVEQAGSPLGSDATLAGQSLFISDDGAGIAPALAELLRRHGAHASVGALEEPWAVEHLIHLGALSAGAAPPATVFSQLVGRLAGLRSLLMVTGTGGSFGRDLPAGEAGQVPPGAGVRGMARSLYKEYPDLRVRSVDLDPRDAPELAARQLLAELTSTDSLMEVGYRSGRRLRLRTVPEPLVHQGGCTVRPEAGDVVLITGGGRGITAAVAVALARQGCHLELVGRTPLPDGPEAPATATCADHKALRQLLAGAGNNVASAIESDCLRIMAQRQLRHTLAEVLACGGSVDYHALDVRDTPAMTALVEDIYRRRGRLDGIIHGAGVVEDRLAADKTVESFARVYDTKVDGARILLGAARPGLRFVVLFGSIAGAFGNRGQIDYAAANEALEAMAWAHNRAVADRVVCIHWGPWGATGMVSENLGREFARHGVGLIDPEDGVACILRELALGSPSSAAVIVMRARTDRHDVAGGMASTDALREAVLPA